MKKKISTLPLLLVALSLGRCTQARVAAASPGGNGAPENFKDLDYEVKDDVPRTKSVVQDWNLVCEQLYGAGLGGPACGPHHSIVSEPQNLQPTIPSGVLLGENKRTICRSLCRLDLGGAECPCNTFSFRDLSNLNRLDDQNSVCHTFCKQNNISLSGCSPCIQKTVPDTADLSSTAQTYQASNNSDAKNTAALLPPAEAGPANRAEPEDESVQVTSPGPTSSTTPNWDEVCLSLCKIGEGGALCNCDLPPFF